MMKMSIFRKTNDENGIQSEESFLQNNLFTGCMVLLFIITVIAGFLTIGKDMQSLLRYDLLGFFLSLIVMPITSKLFASYDGRGYLFGRVIGLTLCSFIPWILSSIHIVSFGIISCYVLLVIVAAVIYAVFILSHMRLRKNGSVFDISDVISDLTAGNTLSSVLMHELIFLAVFLAFTWLMGHRIPSTETERIMDYAFMVTIDKSAYMPPLDMWAAGQTLNYYYYGLYLMTYISKVAFVPMSEGYSLGLAFIAAICLIFSALIVIQLLSGVSKKSEDDKRVGAIPYIGGVLAAFAVGICGNVHYLVFYKIAPTLWDILQIPGDKPGYWFASSTRYVGYIPVNEADRTISEFPSYSFLIGDLHAHVTDVPIVLTIIGLLVAYASKAFAGNEKEEENIEKYGSFIRRLFDPAIIFIAFFIGIAAMTNYWDYPIYYVVAGSIILMTNLYRDKISRALGLTAVQGIFVILFAQLVKMMFELRFIKMFNGIKFSEQHSLLHQLIVLWGLPVMLLVIYMIFLWGRRKSDDKPHPYDICVLLLGLCATGLMLMPEVVYAEDIYVNGFPRCNTMFKLSYQAFILFGLMMAYVIVRVLASKKDGSLRRWTVCGLVILIMTGGFFITACSQWYGKVSEWNYKGIDATFSARMAMGSEAEVLDWIEQNTNGQENILVAAGDSYSTDSLIPALTGHPTIIGWNTHEWLWHNSADFCNDRRDDVSEIYTSDDMARVKELIDKYDIKYIYAGPKEYEKYGLTGTENLEKLGQVVYRNNEISSVIIKCGS